MTHYRAAGCRTLFPVVFLLAARSIHSAGDVLPITDLLTSPERYAFRTVRVEGTVSNLRTESFINAAMRRRGCNQYFTLDDGTGARPDGLSVIAPDGALLGTIETGQPTSNVAWGEDGSTLFITGDSSVYRLRLTTSGARY